MPINLATLKDKRSSLRFEFEGETVNAEYFPHKITPEYRAKLAQMSRDEDDDSRDSSAQMLSEIVINWDVMAGDDPFPPTYENLLIAPQALLGRMVNEITEDLGKLAAPNKAKR